MLIFYVIIFQKEVDNMNNKYAEAQKQSVLELFANSESVSTIVATTGIPRSTIYTLIKASREKKKELSLRNLHYNTS